MLIKENEKIITNWYQKPTNTDRILNYNLSYEIYLKRNIVFNLVDRADYYLIKNVHNFNLKFIKDLLIKNAHPKNFIDVCVRNNEKDLAKCK